MRAGGSRKDGHDPTLAGVYYAIVCQNKDEEKQLGRIKVRFPWLPGGDQDQSTWAQMAVPMEGGEFGTFTLPEVDDTVFVVFLAGDINHPVVIGGCWNKTDAPPEVNENGNNDFRFIKSRSGSRLLFDDSSSTKVVLTDGANGNYVGCGKFASGGDGPNKMEISKPSEINGSATQGVGVASTGTVNVWCPNGNLKVEAMHIEITASQKVQVKAGGDATFEGSMKATCASAATLDVKGSQVKVN
jgi:uncharacterized protein involved in type VI secretion and phage assembly